MAPIHFRCNRKSYSSTPTPGEGSAKFNSEVVHDFSKAKFHTPTIRYERGYLVSLTFSITRMYIDVFRPKVNQLGVL